MNYEVADPLEARDDNVTTAWRVERYAIDLDQEFVGASGDFDPESYEATVGLLDSMYPYLGAHCMVRGYQLVFAYDEDGDVAEKSLLPNNDWTYGVHRGFAILTLNTVIDDEVVATVPRVFHMLETGVETFSDDEGNTVIRSHNTYFLADAEVMSMEVEGVHSYEDLSDDPIAERIDIIVFDDDMPLGKKVELLQRLFVIPGDVTIEEGIIWNQRLSYLNSLGLSELCHVLSTFIFIGDENDSVNFGDSVLHSITCAPGMSHEYDGFDRFVFLPEIKKIGGELWTTGRRRLGAAILVDDVIMYVPLHGDIVVGELQAA